jgi:tetratricopeptide (TPR) repeat protein
MLPSQEIIEEKPESNTKDKVRKWLLKGLDHESKGEYENAINCYKNAISGVESDKEAWNNIGLVYYQMGQFKNADDALNKALELDSEYAMVWETKGYLYAHLNRFDDAVEFLSKALEVGGNKASIWVTLGIISSTQLKFEDAIMAYEKALEVDPENLNALNNEAIAFQLLSQLREERESIEMLEKAVEYFERALAIDPNKAEIWNNYGVVLGFLGRFKSGLSAVDKAIMLAPNYANAYFNKARIYIQVGNPKKALSLLKHAIEMDNTLYEKAKKDLTLRKLKDTSEFQLLNPENGI